MKASETIQKNNIHIDYLLLGVCLSLIIIGYLMVVSSSLHLGEKMKISNVYHYPIRQIVHILAGIVAAVGVTFIPLKLWEKAGPWLFIVGIFLLVIVLIPGVGIEVNGSMRWLSVAGIRIQVSEIVKLTSVIYMAGYVTRHQQNVQMSAYGLVKPLLVFSVACFLLLMEPDFGSVVVILSIAMGIMYLGGARLWQFLMIIAVLLILGYVVITFSGYRMARIIGFLDPWGHAKDSGYQLTQALIAFGRGEIFGVGLGGGIQKLSYLPEAHTDFLFSVLAEELGLIGVVVTISLFAFLVWHIFTIANRAEQVGNKFASFVAYGLGIWFGFQALVNMGVNMGMLPTKGITLPLMSYGGGSMVTMCVSIALLFRVQSETVTVEKSKSVAKRRSAWAGG